MSEGHDDHGHDKQSFISKYIFSYDHKMIAKQYLTLVMFMAVVGGSLAMLVRLQLGWPGQHAQFWETLFPAGMASGVMTPEFYVMLFTMHGTIMVFFVLSLGPVSGFGNFLIPLQVGARDMAFPFLNMMSFWTALPGAIIILISFFVEGGAAASGWTAYPPLSAIRSAIPGSAMGQTLWIVGMIFFIASFTMGGLNFVVTILNLRTKGLKMMRLPLTTWAQFLVGILGLLAFPALAAGSILLLFDRGLGTSFYLPAGIFIGDTLFPHSGGSPLLWQHLFWFLGHPEVYIIMLPALGFTSDIISTFTRRPIFGYRSMVYAIVAIAMLSFVVWGHHMFVSRDEPFPRHGVHDDDALYRGAIRREGVQLARHPVEGEDSIHDADAVRARDRVALRDGRADRYFSRHERRRYPAARYVFSSSPISTSSWRAPASSDSSRRSITGSRRCSGAT